MDKKLKDGEINICPMCGEKGLTMSRTDWKWFEIMVCVGHIYPGEEIIDNEPSAPYLVSCSSCGREWGEGEFEEMLESGEYNNRIKSGEYTGE